MTDRSTLAGLELSLHRGLDYLAESSDILQGRPLTQALVLELISVVPGAESFVQLLVNKLDERALELLKAGSLAEAFKVLQVLHAQAPTRLRGEHLAAVGKRLIACELQPGGPYATAGAQPDLLTNLWINQFIAQYAQPLPVVEAFLDRAIVAGEYHSGELPPLFVMYALAQKYHEQGHEALAKQLAVQPCRSMLEMMLCAAGLERLGRRAPSPQFRQKLRTQQQADGAWRGAKALPAPLATALALRLLVLPAHKPKASKQSAPAAPQIAIFQQARQVLPTLTPPLKRLCLQGIDRIEAADKNSEIALLPLFFQSALPGLPGNRQLATTLGVANIYLWLAYTIYDDFLDEEGTPLLLPVANVALRTCLQLYEQSLPGNPGFGKLVRQVFDNMDAANAWEIRHCRYVVQNEHIELGPLPRFGARRQLADHSFAHMLGPLSLLVHQGLQIGERQWQLICQGLRHYLIARQLNDDLHDWRTDLRAGHISYTVASLLQDSGARPGRHRLPTLVPKLEQEFWRRSLQNQCQTSLQHMRQARRLLQQSGVVHLSGNLLQLFTDIEQPAQAALAEQANQKAFLKAYAN